MKNRIKQLRKEKHLTLKALGEQIGMPNNTLSQYETGKRNPKIETWQALADFFEVSVPYLQGELAYGNLTPEGKKLEDRLSRAINNAIADELKYSSLSDKENRRATKIALQDASAYSA